VILFPVRGALLVAALALAFGPSPAGAIESPSYTAYSEGKYLTALKLAEAEAAQGSKEAYTLMGEIYAEGLGVAQDLNKAADAYAKAAEWTGRAAEAGLAEAQVEYGVMLFKGEGVAVDEARAAKLFRLSAEQGNPVAQNRLARLYANGVVVKADPVQAAKWHLLARTGGVSDFSLDILLAKLTKDERAKAESEADDWRMGRLTEQ
jgi:TPR repeat protein